MPKALGGCTFLCDGDEVHEEVGFSTLAYSPDHRFIIMHEAAAAALQLDLFPTDGGRLPDHKRSFGDCGGRFSSFMA